MISLTKKMIFFLMPLHFICCKAQSIKGLEGQYLGTDKNNLNTEFNLKQVEDSIYYFNLIDKDSKEGRFLGIIKYTENNCKMINTSSLGENLLFTLQGDKKILVDSTTEFFMRFKGAFLKSSLIPNLSYTDFYDDEKYHFYELQDSMNLLLYKYPIKSKEAMSYNLAKSTKFKMLGTAYESQKNNHNDAYFYISFEFQNEIKYGWISYKDMYRKSKRLYIYKYGDIEEK